MMDFLKRYIGETTEYDKKQEVDVTQYVTQYVTQIDTQPFCRI